MNINLPDYKKAPLLNEEVSIPKSNLHKLSNQLQVIREWIANLLFDNAEFKISELRDNTGNIVWKIDDYRSNHSIILESEEEVRIWIEKSFYDQNMAKKRPLNAFDLHQQRLFR